MSLVRTIKCGNFSLESQRYCYNTVVLIFTAFLTQPSAFWRVYLTLVPPPLRPQVQKIDKREGFHGKRVWWFDPKVRPVSISSDNYLIPESDNYKKR
jgi:hypothetical protein